MIMDVAAKVLLAPGLYSQAVPKSLGAVSRSLWYPFSGRPFPFAAIPAYPSERSLGEKSAYRTLASYPARISTDKRCSRQ